MELECIIVRCWRCGRKNWILLLRGTGAYQCDGCDAVVLDSEEVKVSGGKSPRV